MALWNTVPSSTLLTAVNRPFKKEEMNTDVLSTSDGRRNATFNRLVFLEARVQNNTVGGDQQSGYTIDSFDLTKAAKAGLDLAVQTQGLMFNINPYSIVMTYEKDYETKAMGDSNLRDIPTAAPLSQGVQFFGNKTTVMSIEGYTGVPEKDSMIMTLTNLASLGSKWWTVTTSQAQGWANKGTAALTTFLPTATPESILFKRLGNLPIRWQIIHYACDTLVPFTESDLINKDMKDRPANNPVKSMQGEGKQRKEIARFYWGRVVSIEFYHSVSKGEITQNDIQYKMKVNIDQFDDNIAITEGNKWAKKMIGDIGSQYITGL